MLVLVPLVVTALAATALLLADFTLAKVLSMLSISVCALAPVGLFALTSATFFKPVINFGYSPSSFLILFDFILFLINKVSVEPKLLSLND